jgi:ring-1,2-phenylacetyl-CoA epoxidase subunit PaaC
MIDKNTLLDYLLHLADNSLILGQRNAEWCGHGPVLEQDIALTNISLDLFGEARSLFQYAAEVKGGETTEDSLAFLRDALEYRNLLLLEYENTDWAFTIVRQFFFDVYHYNLHKQLSHSKDERLKEIALKTIKETTYHLKWSSEWVIRLGDGTDVSKNKMQTAINNLWDYTGEMFVYSESEKAAFDAGIGANLEEIKNNWNSKVQEIFDEAGLSAPENSFTQLGGKTGLHTEKLGYILAEMQYLQRAYPNAQW